MTASAEQGGATTQAARPSTPQAGEVQDAKAGGGKKVVVLGVLAVIALAGTGYWLYERQFEDTDDAQIDANISNISPRVSGTITAVHVVENQRVKAGDVLAEIDPSDLQVAVEARRRRRSRKPRRQLKVEDPSVSITETTNKTTVATSGSDIASARSAVEQQEKSVAQIAAQLTQAEANDKNVQLEKARAKTAHRSKGHRTGRVRPSRVRGRCLGGQRGRAPSGAGGGQGGDRREAGAAKLDAEPPRRSQGQLAAPGGDAPGVGAVADGEPQVGASA